MVNNNKILTVSYGTFSCTLEGFDDSFGTMKAIAEYFRDLASDDRYFGAEPPQPDAEMLARIAQKEISRRVEAHEEDGNFVLRADAQAAAIAAPIAEAPETAPAPEAPVEVTQAPETPVATEVASEPEPVAAPAEAISGDAFAGESYDDADEAIAPMTSFMPQPKTPTAPAVSGDSIAAKLQRIRAVVSRGEDPSAAPAFSEDEHSENLLSVTAQDLEAALAADDAAMVADEATVDIEGDDVASLLHRLTTQDEAEAETEEEDEIEAVAEQDIEDESLTDNDLAEDDDDQDLAAEDAVEEIEAATEMDEDDFEASIAKIEEALADEQPDTQDATDNEQDDVELENVDDIKAAIQAETLLQDDDADNEADNDFTDEASDLSADTTADDGGEGENLFDDDDGSYDGSDNTLDLSGYDIPAKAKADAEEEMYEDEDDVEDEAQLSPLRARVIKVKRADLDAALADGSIEEEEDTPTSSLSDEEEADLLRDLAEAQAIGSDANSAVTAEDDDYMLSDLDRAQDGADLSEEELSEEDEEATEAEAALLLRSNLHLSQDEEGGDLSRLMDEAKHQMDEPEGTGRRDAIAHLRAAVAATKAEKTLGSDKAEDDAADVYREDLANVVRPRRPSASEGRTQRPGEGRPAPLKLVAEQRIDMVNSSGPVRPRRVATPAGGSADTDMDETSSFAEYAQNMGATKLPDLLEAAASYMSFVEGREQFSRPQLMNKIRQIEKEDFSREDGLRSFGQLLRAGKIEKLKGGRFTVSDRIAFKPDEREAG